MTSFEFTSRVIVMTRRVRLTILLMLAVAVLALWLAPKAARWLAVDRCLDSGGRWDTAQGQCEH